MGACGSKKQKKKEDKRKDPYKEPSIANGRNPKPSTPVTPKVASKSSKKTIISSKSTRSSKSKKGEIKVKEYGKMFQDIDLTLQYIIKACLLNKDQRIARCPYQNAAKYMPGMRF
jgi:hypothetical protein